ncbi:MAG: DUF4342 domain-containing protein [Dehalobacterium sp.]
MDETLKKIDQIRNRTGVSYSTAKEALEKCGGDVLDAIIYLENQDNSSERRTMEHGKDFWHGFQEVVQKGKDTKIRVMKEGKQVAEVPAAAGVLGLVGAFAIPGLAAIGAVGSVAALLNKYSLEIKKEDDLAGYKDSENDIDNLD